MGATVAGVAGGADRGVQVDALASLPHYEAHIAPVWAELERRGLAGVFYGVSKSDGRPRFDRRQKNPTRPILVASWADARRCKHRPHILLEHGAGQVYTGDPRMVGHPSYSGGGQWPNAVLFLCPSETVAGRWRARYPGVSAVAVGCPRLDQHHGRSPEFRNSKSAIPTVAVTFHWMWQHLPETRSCWPHYDRVLPDLAADPRWNLLGHGHPRLWGRISRRWRALGVDHTDDLDDVLARADVLVADNTSALPEAASCGIPLVWVSCPPYRRDVHHGGRFWEWPQGQVQVEHPDDLVDAVATALEDPAEVRAAREAMVDEIYVACDGKASVRAADAIEAVVA